MYAASDLQKKWKKEAQKAILPDTPEVVTLKQTELRLAYLAADEQMLCEGLYVQSHDCRREEKRLAEVQNDEKQKAQIQKRLEKMRERSKLDLQDHEEIQAEIDECETALKEMKKNSLTN